MLIFNANKQLYNKIFKDLNNINLTDKYQIEIIKPNNPCIIINKYKIPIPKYNRLESYSIFHSVIDILLKKQYKNIYIQFVNCSKLHLIQFRMAYELIIIDPINSWKYAQNSWTFIEKFR